MKKSALLCVLLAGAAASTSTFAQESAIRVRAGIASVNYVSPDNTGGPDFESNYAAVLVGGSYIAPNGWFGDLSVRTSTSAKWNTGEVFATPAVADDDFSRTETTLTVGKALGDGLSVFGGIQFVKAEATLSAASVAALGGTSNGGDITLENTIFFVGASKAIPVGPGSLSFSGALGTLSEETKSPANLVTPGDPASTDKADTGFGYSLGVAYSYPITKVVGILADLKYQSYSVKYTGDASDQKVTSLGLAVVGQF